MQKMGLLVYPVALVFNHFAAIPYGLEVTADVPGSVREHFHDTRHLVTEAFCNQSTGKREHEYKQQQNDKSLLHFGFTSSRSLKVNVLVILPWFIL